MGSRTEGSGKKEGESFFVSAVVHESIISNWSTRLVCIEGLRQVYLIKSMFSDIIMDQVQFRSGGVC